jgi:hypothetical protein
LWPNYCQDNATTDKTQAQKACAYDMGINEHYIQPENTLPLLSKILSICLTLYILVLEQTTDLM